MRIKFGKIKYKGASLVEVILYLALTSSMLLMLSTTFNSYLKARSRSQVREEVNSQARYIIKEINNEITIGTGITTPVAGGSGQSLGVVGGNGNPNSTISLTNGNLVYDNGTINKNLNTDRIDITEFIVNNYSGVDGNTIISYSVTLSYAQGNALEFDYANTYQSSVSLKINGGN